MADDSCLFLEDWEAARHQAHSERRQQAEQFLCNLQLRTRNANASLDAWLTVLQTRRRLDEVAAGAGLSAVNELETLWRPQRVEDCDGEAAAWLLGVEKSNIALLSQRASCWAKTGPNGGADLRQRYKDLSENLLSTAVANPKGAAAKIRAWDEANVAVEQAWQNHNSRVQAAATAVAEEQAPPDIWMSEVHYRELARNHLSSMLEAEVQLRNAGETLNALEAERANFWNAFVEGYSETHKALSGASISSEAPVQAPPLRIPSVTLEASAGASLPDMPSSSGCVLQRLRVAAPVEKGMFGLGGGGWKEGFVLVLTMHGYLHVFGTDVQSAKAPSPPPTTSDEVGVNPSSSSTAPSGGPSSVVVADDLVESAIKASVYVPKAVRCLFLRKGKELTVDLAEAEVSNNTGSEGKVAGLRRLLGGGNSEQAAPRKIQARIDDEAEFSALERRCQEFVRRGQASRR